MQQPRAEGQRRAVPLHFQQTADAGNARARNLIYSTVIQKQIQTSCVLG